MIRTPAKFTALAAFALLGGAVGLNCSKSSNPGSSGDLKIAFAIPDGTTISTVHYAVTSNPGAVAGPSGSFDTSDKNASASLDISLQPTGTGVTDTVTLTATTSAGVACTGTSAAFTIVSNAPTLVNMQLICGNGTATSLPGTVDVRATVTTSDNCPNITQAIVAPAQTSVGASVSVSAVASDADSDTLSYTWGPAANFTNPVGTSDTYNCTAAGAQTITLTVDDHHTGGNCTATISLPVTCIAVAVCGNGIVEPGETCDDSTPTCVNCQRVTGTGGTAGAGTGGAATGGTAGAGTGGAATGGTAGAGTGGAATGGIVGTGGVPATGGVVGTGGVPATGGTVGSTGGSGGMSGVVEDNAACVTCETTGTNSGTCGGTRPTGAASNGGFGCDGFTSATDVQNCLLLLQCLRGTACQSAIANADSSFGEPTTYPVPFDDPHPCLCGPLSLTACTAISSGWTGVCATAFANAANGSVSANFTNKGTPLGIALDLMTCDIDQGCKSQCVIPQ